MQSKDDADLRFLKQIGVDALDIELIMVKGYRETGTITRPALRELMSRFDAAGLKIERANALGDYMLNAHLARPEGNREIENLKRIGEILAEAESRSTGSSVARRRSMSSVPATAGPARAGAGAMATRRLTSRRPRHPSRSPSTPSRPTSSGRGS